MANRTKVTTEFNIKHNQSSYYAYNHKKGVYLKHNEKELIVMCLGHSWDSKFFKGIIIFCGGDNSFRSTELNAEALNEDAFVESDVFYCEAGDLFDSFITDEFTLFEGEITIRQYDK